MYGHSKTNKLDRCTRAAHHSPNLGPTTITDNATTISTPITIARPTAKGRVFQNGRSSFTQYAIFKASMAAENPPDDAQRVPRTPRERNVPRFGVITSDNTPRTIPILSGGRTCAIMLSAWLKRSGSGKYATMADKNIRPGKIERTK